jgi:hypothetical protein
VIREKCVRNENKKRSVTNDRIERPVKQAKVNLHILENSSCTGMVSCISLDDSTTIQRELSLLYTDVKLWEKLRKFISNSSGPKVSENPFTLTEQCKYTLSDAVLDDEYMGN